MMSIPVANSLEVLFIIIISVGYRTLRPNAIRTSGGIFQRLLKHLTAPTASPLSDQVCGFVAPVEMFLALSYRILWVIGIIIITPRGL